MTTLPEPFVLDLETEGEFLTDDKPGPTHDAPTADTTHNARTSGGKSSAAHGAASRLTAGMIALARRETIAVRTGAKVLRAERAAWLNASDETPAHLRAGLLNHRYSTWTSRQQSEAKNLEEKAAELAKQADKLDRQAGQLLAAASADPEDAGKQATALRRQAASLRKEAAGWRKQATEASQRPYTAHLEPAEADLRRHRHRTATRRWAATAALGLAIGWAEIRIGGALLPALTASGITTTAWAKGRFPGWRRELPEVPPLAYELGTDHPAGTTGTDQSSSAGRAGAATPGTQTPGDTGKPFTIHEATTPATATECVRRALLAERVPVAHVGDAVEYSWGWESVARVSEGTPGVIANKLGDLETRFDVGDGDVILQPNRKRTAEALLRVVTGDLFGEMKPPPYRAPHSVDITKAGVFGMSADGTDLSFSLAELMGEIIARSGGGKSTIMRDLLDWTTAAYNATTVFLDPSGDGPGQFTDAVKLTATGPIQIEFILLSLYRLAAGRARIRRKLGMGDAWECTREHPAVIVFIDEFPKLTKRSKQIIAELMLVGRKEGVWLIFAAQGSTKELLGSNIAQHPALKIIGACRDVDTTGALGSGAADFGYLPHRLHPKSGKDLNHCAQTYIVGAPGLSEDPMLHKWHYIPDDEGGRRAAERLAAGLVDVDQASIDAALKAPNPPGLKFADEEEEYLHYVPWPDLLAMVAEPDDHEDEPEDDDPADLPPILQAIRDAFVHESEPEYLTMDQLHGHLREDDPGQWAKWDDRDDRSRLRELGKALSRALRDAGVELSSERITELDGQPRGYYFETVQQALSETE
ncbi:hypothetical protein [Streptomyces sp. NBC_00439]|uniref:hypothetical protein n=1 Tax=Streptomyces sp. NBC_00439 TaxID=2903650 RepID=UPI0022597F90|nr:hypothetical protein [Streptomyces sp. NBC_00439]MCX5106883.1 hypothetical protein [Streptomyces sp. NBC_00439]